MRALTLTAHGGLDRLEIRELPRPVVQRPDDVLVRIHAAALNHLDLFVLDGLPGVTLDFPHVVAGDGAGVVEEVGSGVRSLEPGQRVMINPGLSCGECDQCLAGEQSLCVRYQLLGEHVTGTAAEYVVLPARNLAPVPDSMPWPQAAAFSLATLTAWRMLVTRARVRPGETILIWGIGGGVALAALQIAKLMGAFAIVTSSSESKLKLAESLGADIRLNHNTSDIPREIRALTGRRGVDVVLDNVGTATWERSLRCLGRQGRLVTCGGTSGPMVETDVRKLFWYQWTIMGSTMGNHAEYQEIVRLANQGALWPVVDRVFPLEAGVEAFTRLRDGNQAGKLVIEVT